MGVTGGGGGGVGVEVTTGGVSGTGKNPTPADIVEPMPLMNVLYAIP